MSTKTTKDPGFPLTFHPQGYYCKRILGRLHYFGKRNGDKFEALRQYEFERPYLEAGIEPPKHGGMSLAEALDRFLVSKELRMKAGELSLRSFEEYERQCKRILLVISRSRIVSTLSPSDFDRLFASFNGCPKTIEGYVTRSKVAFRWIEKSQGLKFNYGDHFRKPTARRLRQHRNRQPKRLFEAAELRQLVTDAKPTMRGMILLGVNCGFGNEDCATLKIEDLDLKHGWHNHGRPKTGIERRGRLWPETIEALRVVIGERDSGFVFLTQYGNAWSNGTNSSPISKEFRKLADKIECKRSFYDLRRTFQTVGDDSKDPVAVKAIMGHIDASMSGVYRQAVPDDRLEAVSKVVHKWYVQSGRKCEDCESITGVKLYGAYAAWLCRKCATTRET